MHWSSSERRPWPFWLRAIRVSKRPRPWCRRPSRWARYAHEALRHTHSQDAITPRLGVVPTLVPCCFVDVEGSQGEGASTSEQPAHQRTDGSLWDSFWWLPGPVPPGGSGDPVQRKWGQGQPIVRGKEDIFCPAECESRNKAKSLTGPRVPLRPWGRGAGGGEEGAYFHQGYLHQERGGKGRGGWEWRAGEG